MTSARRSSKKRQAIYDALCATRAHPSAEQLYNGLKNDIPDLSLGTVYRNLNVLRSDGLIKSVGCINGEERYDANLSRHSHFICTSCGKIEDIMLDLSVEESYDIINERTGGAVEAYSLCYTGLCKNCCEKRH